MLNIAMSPEQFAGLVKDAEGTGFGFLSPDEDAVEAGQKRAWWEQVEITKVEVEDDPAGDNFPNNARVKVSVEFRVADEGNWLDHEMKDLGLSENAGRTQTDRFYVVPVSEVENLNKMTNISTGKLGQIAFAGLNINTEEGLDAIPTDAEGNVNPLELVQQAQGTFMWARFRRYKDSYTKEGDSKPTEMKRSEFSQAMPIEIEG